MYYLFMIGCPKKTLKLRQVESLPSRKSWDVDPWGQKIIKGKECIYSHTGVIIWSRESYSSVGSWAPDSVGPGHRGQAHFEINFIMVKLKLILKRAWPLWARVWIQVWPVFIFLQFHCTYSNSLAGSNKFFLLSKSNVKEKYTLCQYELI